MFFVLSLAPVLFLVTVMLADIMRPALQTVVFNHRFRKEYQFPPSRLQQGHEVLKAYYLKMTLRHIEMYANRAANLAVVSRKHGRAETFELFSAAYVWWTEAHELLWKALPEEKRQSIPHWTDSPVWIAFQSAMNADNPAADERQQEGGAQ
ncbi:MAG: hypothetical protein HYW89_00315 [Candidatus Sungiibacteriota bacterium]|uniref:Uncharacterized protein n=1 Tax=Candidatus Sungiibacteriota bacterium TaxID=2750080 RepID=A0A7T5UQR0_9BACT|nr:MAG: hypothetical protein HYW89_00315 [Candidatus Sungbacteria bacterium]